MEIGASGRAQEFLVQERPRGNRPGLHPALLAASLNIRKGDTQQDEEASDRGMEEDEPQHPAGGQDNTERG